MPRDELIAALEKATADSAGLMLEAWEHLCRTSVGFRRYACTSVDEYGLTVTGRFCRYVDVGAYESAALLMVPQGCGWRIWAPAADSLQPHRATIWAARGQPMFAPFDVDASTPALAICIAALRATERGEAGR